MKRIKVKIKRMRESEHPLPAYATEGSAAVDFYAHIGSTCKDVIMRESDGSYYIELCHGERALIPLGVAMAIPEGYVLQLTPRSGLAAKKGITLTNAPGVVDCDFRGEIGAIVQNLGDEIFVINDGDKICQGGFYEYEKAEFEETDELDKTERSAGGFGSTGV